MFQHLAVSVIGHIRGSDSGAKPGEDAVGAFTWLFVICVTETDTMSKLFTYLYKWSALPTCLHITLDYREQPF